MKTSALILLATAHSYICSAQIIGVAPKDQDLYKPDSQNKWKCLNHPEIELNFNQINDDYCDCPDGSDEPGTAACSNGLFYCENKGHIPQYIKSYLVNDGRCDYELCCDGSDEWNTPIECPNKCEEINKEFKAELKKREKTYQIGSSKVRDILKKAEGLRNELKTKLENGKIELYALRKELDDYNANGKKSNGDSSQSVNKQLEDGIKTQLEELKDSVIKGFEEIITNNKDLIQLKKISQNLLDTFNPNLNDNAVKKSIIDYQQHLEKFEEQYKESFNLKELSSQITKELNNRDYHVLVTRLGSIANEFGSSLITNGNILERSKDLENILQYLIDNYNPNFNDPNVKEAVQSFQDFISNKQKSIIELKPIDQQINKINESLKELGQRMHAKVHVIENKTSILDSLRLKFRDLVDEFLGVQSKTNKKKGNNSNGNINIDEHQQKLINKKDQKEIELSQIELDLDKDLGPNDILRALKDIKISNKIGEYDYDLSFVGDIKQRGHGDTKIGKYESYELNELDNKSYQFILYYKNGQTCWNGPKRSAVVFVECGEDNEILSVTEPEKCEYHFKVVSPIGCKP